MQRFDSRQTMQRSDFEIFHYRDRELRSVGLHYHDFYEVYYFHSGEVEYRVEGRVYQLTPGDLLLLPPQKLHQVVVTPGVPYERMVLWLDSNFLQTLGADLTGCFLDRGTGHLLKPNPMQKDRISQLFHRLIRESDCQELYGDVLCQGLLMELMAELNRMAAQDRGALTPPRQDLVDQVLTYIGNHYWEDITVESLAETFFVSKYHLSHQFTSRVGTSPYRYILFRRLTLARELMAEGVAPGQVYRSCGFGDYANFYRAFRGQYGISPGEFTK